MRVFVYLVAVFALVACGKDKPSTPDHTLQGAAGRTFIYDAPDASTPEDAGVPDASAPDIVDASVPMAGHSAAGAPSAGRGGSSAAGKAGSLAGSGGVGGSMAGSGGAGGEIAGMGGSDAAAGAGGADSKSQCSGPPGLYQDTQCSVLSAGVKPYTPQFPLWTDGAVKQRWIYLPAGTTIDASDPDHWKFPVGAKLWKEFRSPDGKLRVETRVFEKIADTTGTSGWSYDTYAWSADQLSVAVVTDGVTDALGTGLDIPARQFCTNYGCHNHSEFARDMVNGFQAIQLNWTGAQETLQGLIDAGTLVNARADIVTAAVIPGRNATETAAFGAFLGNCGHCHTAKNNGNGTYTYGDDAPHSMALQTLVGVPLAQQPAWTTTVCVYPHTPTDSFATQRISVGSPTNSAIYNRDRVRGLQHPNQVVPPAAVVNAGPSLDGPSDSIQMPPIGTNVVDVAMMVTESAWIQSLTSCVPN